MQSDNPMADNLNGLNILPPIVRGAPSIRSVNNFFKMVNTAEPNLIGCSCVIDCDHHLMIKYRFCVHFFQSYLTLLTSSPSGQLLFFGRGGISPRNNYTRSEKIGYKLGHLSLYVIGCNQTTENEKQSTKKSYKHIEIL